MSNNNLINRIFGKSRSTSMDNTTNTTQDVATDNTPTTTDTNTTVQKATFGAGCFWGVEAAYRQVKGVISTAVGYSGGTYDKPSYKDVCTGRTGHAEVVEVT